MGKMSGGYVITAIINNAIPILILPVLTHHLHPGQYANITLFCFYLALANALTGAAVQTVIAKHFFDSDKKQVAMLVGNSLLITMVFSLATMLLIILSYPFLHRYLNLSLSWLVLIPITSFAFNSFALGLTVIRNEKKVLLFSKYQIGNSIVNVVISVVLVAFLFWGWQGRVWGIILANVISAVLMYFYLKSAGYVSFAISRKLIRSILSILVPLMPSSFQLIIISQVGIFFIQLYFSKELLGVYAVAFQVAFAIRLLDSTLSLSWAPYLYEQLAKPNAINRLYLARMLLALYVVMFMGVVFINVFSGVIIALLASKPYWGAREFIPWFTIGYFFHGLYVFLMPFLIKHGKQRYISVVSILMMIITIALNVFLSKAFGYIGIAYAFTIVYFVMFMAFAWKAQRVFPLPWLRAFNIWDQGKTRSDKVSSHG